MVGSRTKGIPSCGWRREGRGREGEKGRGRGEGEEGEGRRREREKGRGRGEGEEEGEGRRKRKEEKGEGEGEGRRKRKEEEEEGESERGRKGERERKELSSSVGTESIQLHYSFSVQEAFAKKKLSSLWIFPLHTLWGTRPSPFYHQTIGDQNCMIGNLATNALPQLCDQFLLYYIIGHVHIPVVTCNFTLYTT